MGSSSINNKGFSFLIWCDHYLMFTEDAQWTCFISNTKVILLFLPFQGEKAHGSLFGLKLN